MNIPRLAMYRLLCFLLLLTSSMPLSALPLDSLMRAYGMVEVTSLAPHIRVQLKYATRDNFIGANMYGTLPAPWHALRRPSSTRSPAMPSSSMTPHAHRAYSAVCTKQ